jgi:hypothetical protein
VTLERMLAYFQRHTVDRNAPGWGVDSRGWQAWLLWGGDPGYAWAQSVLRGNSERLSVPGAALIAADILAPDPVPGLPGPVTAAVLAQDSMSESCPYVPGTDARAYMEEDHAEIHEMIRGILEEPAGKSRDLHLRQLVVDLEQHFLSEEGDIFPPVATRSAAKAKALKGITHEHPALLTAAKALLRRYSAQALRALDQKLRDHGAREETVLFGAPLAKGSRKGMQEGLHVPTTIRPGARPDPGVGGLPEEMLRTVRRRLLARGLTMGERALGRGSYGVVFPLEDGRVVKVTTDWSDAAAVQRVLDALAYGETSQAALPSLADFQAVYAIPVDGDTLYAVVMPCYLPLPAPEANLLYWIGDALVHDEELPYTVPDALREDVARLERTMQELRRLGVDYMDLHGNNVMRDPDGDWAIIDIGGSTLDREISVETLLDHHLPRPVLEVLAVPR